MIKDSKTGNVRIKNIKSGNVRTELQNWQGEDQGYQTDNVRAKDTKIDNISSLHEKCRSVGQNQQNFILSDTLKNFQNYNDNI